MMRTLILSQILVLGFSGLLVYVFSEKLAPSGRIPQNLILDCFFLIGSSYVSSPWSKVVAERCRALLKLCR